MELKDMTIEQIEERKKAIVSELDVEGADLDALENEMRSLNEELEKRKAAEAKKNEVRNMVAQGAGVVVTEVPKEERKGMEQNKVNIRESKEYALAYFRAIVKGDDTEVRSLLSTNVSGGQIPVPEILDNEIRSMHSTEHAEETVLECLRNQENGIVVLPKGMPWCRESSLPLESRKMIRLPASAPADLAVRIKRIDYDRRRTETQLF